MGFLGALDFGISAWVKPGSGFRKRSARAARGRTSPARPTRRRQRNPWAGLAAATRGDSQHHRQVGRGLIDAHAAHGVDKHVLVGAGHPRGGATPPAAWPGGRAPGPRLRRGLGPPPSTRAFHFHQQRATALRGDEHAAAGHRLGVLAQKMALGLKPLRPLSVAANPTNLVDCPKAVLDGAHQAIAVRKPPLKVQHGVHHVLQHARSGQGAFAGDMAHQHDGAAAGLGDAGEVGGVLRT